MPPWPSVQSFLTSSLPDHCEPTGPFLAFLSSTFQTCIPTPLALVSATLGCLSITAWLFAQLPQIYKNYRLQSTSGLSFYFLAEWCLGDSTNLFGASLTRQATWQVVVAAYYVFVDVILVSQYLWYTHLRSTWHHRRGQTDSAWTNGQDDDRDRVWVRGQIIEGVPTSDEAESETPSSKVPPSNNRHTFSFRGVSASPCLSSFPSFKEQSGAKVRDSVQPSTPAVRISSTPLSSRNTVLVVSMLEGLASARPLGVMGNASPVHMTRLEMVGSLLSWSSTLLYLVSRLPQIYKNHVRQSTSGLSAKLFIAAFFGNLFYSSSILTDPCAWNSFPAYGGHGWVGPEGSDRQDWVARAAPFWLGAAGVLGLDATVGLQFLMFGEGRTFEHERGTEQSVTGWMRGWVPSFRGGDRTVTLEGECQTLTRDDDRSYGSLS